MGGGTLTAGSGSVLTAAGNILENGGTVSLAGAAVTATSFQVAGSPGATLSGFGSIQGDVTNAGEVDVGSTSAVTLTITGNYTQFSGGTNVYSGATMLVTGSLTVQSSVLSLNGATVQANGGLQIWGDAILSGSDTIIADLTNAGEIDLGGLSSVGTLHIQANAALGIHGNFTQTSSGSLFMDIAGPSSNDLLQIDGLATLDGYLIVSLLNGFVPSPGQTFGLLTYGSRSGTFASFSLPTFPGGTFVPEYDTPSGTFSLAVA
jgi:hypothetical protein